MTDGAAAATRPGGTTPQPSTEDTVPKTLSPAEYQANLDNLLAEIGRLTGEVAASLAEVIKSTDYELRDADLTVLDEFNDISDAVFWQERSPGSRIFERPVTTTIVRGEWTEVTR